MPIRYVQGDLLDSWRDGVTVIGHQCNCRNEWSAGLHLQIGKRWRHIIVNYVNTRWSLGDMRIYKTEVPNFRVAYLAGQDDYGDAAKTGKVYTQYWALESAMSRLAARVEDDDVLAFPLIGAGLAGGDWSVIAAIIERVFDDREVLVYRLGDS